MQFPTLEFLVFFLGMFLLVAWLRPKITAYKYLLLALSLIFYASWNLQFVLILLLEIGATFGIIKLIRPAEGRERKVLMWIGISVVVAFWLVFKYFNFFAGSLLELLQNLGFETDITLVQIIAPVGISFYSFRIISHLVDSAKGLIDRKPYWLDYSNYVAFFPQITAGPIAVVNDFYQDLNNRTYIYNTNKVLLLVCMGILKKYVIASFLFDYLVDPFVLPANYSPVDLLIAAIGYSALIYADFSGYNDLATALSNVLGFRVIENFNMPYKSLTVSEFWRRWHMSLGRWLKNYVYIPLGGSRKGRARKYINLLITMTFSGFWHGAGINFIIWGLMHGVGMVWNDMTEDIPIKVPRFLRKFTKPLAIFVAWFTTFGFVVLSRIFFNTPTFDKAIEYFNSMMNFGSGIANDLANEFRLIIVILVVMILNFVEIPMLVKLNSWLDKRRSIWRFIFYFVVGYLLLNLGPGTVAPFIYYKF